jgi:sporulation protein YlmC with PRC-barrel domain
MRRTFATCADTSDSRVEESRAADLRWNRFRRGYIHLISTRRHIMTTSTGHTSAIRASKVIGTTVKDGSGERLGEVKDVVLDKQSNSILFGVVSFGGVLGMGEKYHPVPWAALDYDETENAYVINLTRDQLKTAPADSLEELTRDDGMAYRDRAFEYYGVPRA